MISALLVLSIIIFIVSILYFFTTILSKLELIQELIIKQIKTQFVINNILEDDDPPDELISK